MKPFILIAIIGYILISCDEYDPTAHFNSTIRFEVSAQILEGKKVRCVDFDADGNAWIATGSKLSFYNGAISKTYDVGSGIQDISVGSDGKVWIATADRGLAVFSGGGFTYYNNENSGLPRDLILAVEAVPDGTVWFSSSAHMLGGLMHFDGKDFELFTPENSIINQNLILDLKVDLKGNVLFTSGGTVDQAKVFMIDKQKQISALGRHTTFYWIGSLDVNSKSEPVVVDDHSLYSCAGCYRDAISIFSGGEWTKLETEFDLGFMNRMFVDKRDFIWVQGSLKGDYQSYFVFDGHEWHRAPKDMLSDAFISSVKVDPKNNIWFCTNNGIYILNQN